MTVSAQDKKILLSAARESIVSRIVPGRRKRDTVTRPTPSLEINCGAFVSLYVEGKLRGCIGTFSENETLLSNVRNMAASAAMTDSRFSPIEAGEIEQMKIEISVLTPRKPIDDIGNIILGKHGIYMKKGTSRGTLLPQVAINQGWTLPEFLGNCAKYKAGIGWEGWKTAELFVYEAIVFDSDTAG